MSVTNGIIITNSVNETLSRQDSKNTVSGISISDGTDSVSESTETSTAKALNTANTVKTTRRNRRISATNFFRLRFIRRREFLPDSFSVIPSSRVP